MKAYTIEIDGGNVNYLLAGTAHNPALVLLHGAIGNATMHWESSIDLFSDEFLVLAPFLPGYGESSPLQTWSLPAFVEWLKAFLDTLKLEQAVVIGTDFGAVVARLFAASYPHYTPATILVNGGALPPRERWQLRLVERIPGLSGLAFRLQGRSVLSSDGLSHFFNDPALLTDDIIGAAQRETRGLIGVWRAEIRGPIPRENQPMVPTLLLWGENDTATSLDDAHALQQTIAGAQLVPIAATKHTPHIEEPEVFVWQVKKFIDELSRPRYLDNLPGPSLLGG